MMDNPPFLRIDRLSMTPVALQPVEIVERKGIGHPDTICDRAAEELSISLSRYYLDRFGMILHHNVDKCLLAGGESEVSFGGGHMIKPMYLLFAGRASIVSEGHSIPLDEMVVSRTRSWMKETFRFLDPEKDIEINHRIRRGSAELVACFKQSSDIPMANDTSIGVSFFPHTETERIVRDAELFLNSPDIKIKYPFIGEDIKIMGIRTNHDNLSITAAIAFVAHLIPSLEYYLEAKSYISDLIMSFCSEKTGMKIRVNINAADIIDKKSVYLTRTGLSADSGDDGEVGRGNRIGGIITPNRPMTMEATAGKNSFTHAGKIYNIAAYNISRRLSEAKDISEAYCCLVSQIGSPITEPLIADIKVTSGLGDNELKNVINRIVSDELAGLPFLWKRVINREFELF